MSKQWYQSKTIWVNGIGILAILLQTQTGFIIGAGEQAGIIMLINLMLRAITKDEIQLTPN